MQRFIRCRQEGRRASVAAGKSGGRHAVHHTRLLAASLAFLALPVAAQTTASTLEVVKKRGQVVCGVNVGLRGFSLPDSQGKWKGLDVDMCGAVAVAVLGDATKTKFVPLSAQQRFLALQSGEIDVLVRNSTITLERDAGLGIQ